MEQTEKKKSDPAMPEIGLSKTKLIKELLHGGGMGDDLKRKMRPGVVTIMTALDGKDFADNNYWYICQMIINAGLVLYCPSLCKNLLQESQVNIIKERYPLQLQMLKSLIESAQ